MARVKRGVVSRRKHNKLLESAKGYRMTRNRLVRKAHEAVLHAGQYAYVGRKDRKSLARRDWILHINEALKVQGLKYNQFINKLKVAKIELDRKILATLVLENPDVFDKIVKHAK
ncbi:50S ribosomal protein L20 [Candidatus Gottesmanbacteria bacterium RIFCSPHIGHO2_01_FULL_42_12]|uniref:Large ribosomal subunit protein bL20 n=1 Tax=Candidatus Gottesmanbacteria bacterium RIFCSPHIGHO2_01_FULL_42_12 TaxID=1798377 RepID=A0A1F5Z1S9_9BACT|nr:MAG: 50S ribosomal protein L20 [Candidatus Gottesmanbacteria bacterium RIFCSPHIGHO2_01_FULL_42_12]